MTATGGPVGIMLCGHGSRNRRAVEEFAVLARDLAAEFPEHPVEHGYLEFAKPVLRDGLNTLIAAGCRQILAVPGMLFAAGHAKNDIPAVLNAYQAEKQEAVPELQIQYGRDLGIDPKLLQAAGDRIQEALDSAAPVPTEETLLVVVGRGASDPDANGNVAKITRLLWEGFGFGWAETAYSGVTFPLVKPALENAARLGFRRILVFPYFLFTGVLVQRIYMASDTVARDHPAIEFLKAPYLNNHRKVIETFVDRIHEITAGENLMNCQMCKYRAQVLGFEAEVGAPQSSHHHHVEGVGAHCDLCAPDGTCSGKCQTGAGVHSHESEHGHHHHHHPPYPHADHPLGPRTLKAVDKTGGD